MVVEFYPCTSSVNYQFFPDSKTKSVLIADEECEVREALSVAVRRWAQEEQRNIEAIAVENGLEAVNYLREAAHYNFPLLVILDLRMPKLNGIESAEIIQELCPQTPIIITASQDEIDTQLIQQADEFANQNPQVGFVIRTNSSPLLKVALEFEIRKLIATEQMPMPENTGLFGTLRGTLSQLLKF